MNISKKDKENFLYGIGIVAFILISFSAIWAISKIVNNHKVIQPVPGVSCVVVSKLFNTSVDCWKD